MPRVKGASGPLKLCGGLTLRDAWRSQVELWLKQIGPLEAVPELMAVEIAAAWKIDDSAHGYLAFSGHYQAAKEGDG
jgi:hypothetical protein